MKVENSLPVGKDGLPISAAQIAFWQLLNSQNKDFFFFSRVVYTILFQFPTQENTFSTIVFSDVRGTSKLRSEEMFLVLLFKVIVKMICGIIDKLPNLICFTALD